MIFAKPIVALIGYAIGISIAWFASRGKETIAGENTHQEIYRLREEIGGLNYLLIGANGLLAAILAVLIF